RLLLAGAYRDVEMSRGHPLSQTLGALVREQLFHRVQLDGLTQQEVGELVQGGTGVNLTLEVAEVIHRRTDGNPFFVSEVTRHVTLENITEDPGWVSVIPEGVRDAIGRRLNRLSEQCNQMLTTASVVGRDFEFRLLISLMGDITEDQVLAAMDEAVEVQLIEELPNSVGLYQFTHALIQETLFEELSTTRRVRLHARIAEGLETLYGNDADAHATELAHHFAEAQTLTGPERMVRYSLMAGQQALASYAYEDALTYFEKGLAARDIALSGTEMAPDEDAAAMLFGLAQAQSATVVGHQLVEAFANLSRAFDYYVETGNVAQAVAAAVFPIVTPSYRIPGVTGLLARALTLVPADSHEAGRILSIYGGFLWIDEGDYEAAQQAFGRAISIARREGDVPLEVQVLANLTVLSGQHFQLQECVDNGLRAIELATDEENPMRTSRWWTAMSLLNMGELDAARPHALFLRDLTEKRNTPRLFASNAFTPITSLSCLEGDWNPGREYSDRGLELSPLSPMLLLPRILLNHETGESAHGEVYLERLLEAMSGGGPYKMIASTRVPVAIATIARITGNPDRLEIAESAAETVLSVGSVLPNGARQARSALAMVAVERGDRVAAEEHYADLIGLRGTMIYTASSIDRLLGRLSQTMDNLDQAVAHFEEALTFCRKAGYRPELAWTCCDYADTLSLRDGSGDRAKSIALLEESLAISTELGMRP
ncbi:MAG: tetratricopeptide repeat protein, partial [Dehalococcoidia bacterium]